MFIFRRAFWYQRPDAGRECEARDSVQTLCGNHQQSEYFTQLHPLNTDRTGPGHWSFPHRQEGYEGEEGVGEWWKYQMFLVSACHLLKSGVAAIFGPQSGTDYWDSLLSSSPTFRIFSNKIFCREHRQSGPVHLWRPRHPPHTDTLGPGPEQEQVLHQSDAQSNCTQ